MASSSSSASKSKKSKCVVLPLESKIAMINVLDRLKAGVTHSFPSSWPTGSEVRLLYTLQFGYSQLDAYEMYTLLSVDQNDFL